MLGRRFQDEASPSPLRCGPGGAPEDPAPLLPSLLPNQNHRTNCPERSAAVRQRQMLSSPRSSSGHLGRGYPLAPLILDSPEGSSRLQSSFSFSVFLYGSKPKDVSLGSGPIASPRLWDSGEPSLTLDFYGFFVSLDIGHFWQCLS